MTSPIRETLARCTFHSKRRTFAIVYTECNASVVAKIKFRRVPMQMLFPAMLVDAFHATLEDLSLIHISISPEPSPDTDSGRV